MPTTSTIKKEKILHPSSRKAGQLARRELRKGNMGNMASKRVRKQHSLVDFYGFFYHAIPEQGVLTLSDLHHIVRDIWLTRNDDELEMEKSSRRKGRPKSTKETKLEEIKLVEAEIYRTGMEVIDLTHLATVELFRRWDQTEVAFVQMLRFIRISSTDPQLSIVSRPGKHLTVLRAVSPSRDLMDITGEEAAERPHQLPQILGEPPSRFSSTMMTMDDP